MKESPVDAEEAVLASILLPNFPRGGSQLPIGDSERMLE